MCVVGNVGRGSLVSGWSGTVVNDRGDCANGGVHAFGGLLGCISDVDVSGGVFAHLGFHVSLDKRSSKRSTGAVGASRLVRDA